MTNIKINNKNRTIEMTTKKFAAAASCYGTSAYKELQEARRDYPDYRVITKATRVKKVDKHKGLTYKFMENFIKKHDDESGSVMAEFNNLRATSEEAKDFGAEAVSYGEIKTWFFKQYPEFAEFQKKREEALVA